MNESFKNWRPPEQGKSWLDLFLDFLILHCGSSGRCLACRGFLNLSSFCWKVVRIAADLATRKADLSQLWVFLVLAIWRSPDGTWWYQGRDFARLIHSGKQLTLIGHLCGIQHLLCHSWCGITRAVTSPQNGNLEREVLIWFGWFPHIA